MTEKLYYKDQYLKEFEATVISSEICGELFDTVLDKTAFFPEEGGQYSDTGFIDCAYVSKVEIKDGIIHHFSDKKLSAGSTVKCRLDFDERYEKMQCHSGEHILSGIIHERFGLENVGFHLGADDVTMDINKPLKREELDTVELLANEVIYKNVPITVEFPSPEELPLLNYRSKLDLDKDVRIVNIGEYDSCACCAPHVKNTGEIGLIKILDFQGLRGGIRIHITAGRRAMRMFRSLYSAAKDISNLTSLPMEKISDGVKKLEADNAQLKYENGSLRIRLYETELESMLLCRDKNVLTFEGATVEELREIANLIKEKRKGLFVLLSGVDFDYKFVIVSAGDDVGAMSCEITGALNGRGGGRGEMIQGSFVSSLDEIENYFKYKA